MAEKLYKKTPSGYEEIYPLTYIQSIMDSESGKALTSILGSFNNVYVPYQDSVENTRNMVPESMRRKGLWITYDNGTKYITEYYKGTVDDIEEHWSNSVNWQVVPDLELVQTEASKLPDGIITPDKLSPALQELIKQNNTITNLPDDEDLEERNGVMSLKERKYNPYIASGKGYKILRKNWVKGRNILTQDMISNSNTIYEIRYDFDLNAKEITIPEGCILQFEGGSFSNGTISGDDILINAGLYKIFNNCIFKNLNLVNKSFFVEWFGASNKLLDNSKEINYAIKTLNSLNRNCNLILTNTYTIKDTIWLRQYVSIIGVAPNNVYQTASPKGKKGSGFICDFNDKEKYALDTYIEKDKSQILFPYNKMYIDLNKEILNYNWGVNRKVQFNLKNFSIQIDSNKIIDGPIFGGIRLLDVFYSNINNINIAGVAVGLSINNSWGLSMNKLNFICCLCGVYFGKYNTHQTIYDSIFESQWYNGNLKWNKEVIWKDKESLFPPYDINGFKPDEDKFTKRIEVNSIAIISEGYNIDCNKIKISNTIFQILDAICLIGKEDDELIFDGCYNEAINKVGIWSYGGKVSMINNLKFYSRIKPYTIGTIKGFIKLGECKNKVITCYPNNDNNVFTGIGSDVKLYDVSECCYLYYDRYNIDENGNCIKGNELVSQNKKTLEPKNLYVGHYPFGYSKGDDTAISELNSGLFIWAATSFKNVLSRYNLNKYNIIFCLGYTDFSNDGNIIEAKDIYIKRTNWYSDRVPSFIPLTQPIKLKNSNLYLDGLSFKKIMKDYNIDGVTVNTTLPYVIECYGNCNITSTLYMEETQLFKLMGEDAINLNIELKGFWGNPEELFINLDTDIRYTINITTALNTKTLTNKTRPTKGLLIGDLYVEKGKNIYWNGTIWIDEQGNPVDSTKQGTTQQRPTGVKAGFYYFDTTLNKPIWKKEDTGTIWVDATGAEV